ncbi:hypothetical protein [Amycolatopsis orientalis]|uniref:hypothetical protein n=1 Tax=Amycolatopsis orientalis TaxID=31958 RepID=UPI000401D12E|nr:hypothetical protein [Amycolatopsis orientalis]
MIVLQHDDILSEVHFRIGAQPLALVAGELEETAAGGLIYRRFDESVLAFTDPERIPWRADV